MHKCVVFVCVCMYASACSVRLCGVFVPACSVCVCVCVVLVIVGH